MLNKSIASGGGKSRAMQPVQLKSNGSMANEPLKELNKNPMANERTTTKIVSHNTDKRIDQIASYLVDTFNSPDSWRFYCKVAIQLPQPKIAELVEWSKDKIRQNGGCAGCLFNAVARKEMGLL